MTIIDYASVYSALYSRAATDSAGNTLRALIAALGGGSSSIFPADKLGNLAGRVLPYLVWKPQPVAGASESMRDVTASWFVYGAPNKGDLPLHQIAAALEDLYGAASRFAVSAGHLSVVFIGAPFLDEGLSLKGLEVRIGYRRLG